MSVDRQPVGRCVTLTCFVTDVEDFVVFSRQISLVSFSVRFSVIPLYYTHVHTSRKQGKFVFFPLFRLVPLHADTVDRDVR